MVCALRFLYATTLCRSEQNATHSLRQEAQEFALRAQHGGSGVAVDGGSLPARAAPAPSSTVSVGRFRRLLRRIVQTRQTGAFVPQRSRQVKSLGEEVGKIRGGETLVVDIAKLTDDEQTLVFGDILRTIYNLYAEEGTEREDVPEKVIIFVDELNKYAPARERESPIIQQVLDIAERGRSLGVVLFGAEQFMSAVHERVVGNCATTVIGRSGSAELSSATYRFLDPAVKGNVARLEKGELVISHATFRQPVKIRFPHPAYKQEGTE